MVQAIQVLRFHLLELEKVSVLMFYLQGNAFRGALDRFLKENIT